MKKLTFFHPTEIYAPNDDGKILFAITGMALVNNITPCKPATVKPRSGTFGIYELKEDEIAQKKKTIY